MLTFWKGHIANSDTFPTSRSYGHVVATKIALRIGSILMCLSPKLVNLSTKAADGWELIETAVQQLLPIPSQNHKVDYLVILLPLHRENGVV